MAIAKVFESGFETKTTTGKGDNKVTLEHTTWSYEQHFGITMNPDGSATIAPNRLAFSLWQLRNGVSQRLNDAHVDEDGVKDKTFVVLQKINQFRNGIISAERGPRSTPLESTLRELVQGWLERKGVKKADAVKLARDIPAAATYAATHITENPTLAEQERLTNAWMSAAEKLLAAKQQALNDLPDV